MSLTNQVQLTWDETDHERVTAMNRKFNKDELLDMDFNAYLASSSEEEDDEEGEVELGEEERAGGETALCHSSITETDEAAVTSDRNVCYRSDDDERACRGGREGEEGEEEEE